MKRKLNNILKHTREVNEMKIIITPNKKKSNNTKATAKSTTRKSGTPKKK